MTKNLLIFSFLLLFTQTGSSQRSSYKIECVYRSAAKMDMLSQRWINTFTEITTSGSSYIIHPTEFFQLMNDKTYSRYSNGDKLDGSWDINFQCQQQLDEGASLQRRFDIIKLSVDTLIISRKESKEIYIQHYKASPANSYVFQNRHNGIKP